MYESSSSGLRFLATTDRHNYTVTGLLSDTNYTFIVKAYNSKGEGPGAAFIVKTKGGKYCFCWLRSLTMSATTSRLAKTSLFLKRLYVFLKFAALISTRLKGAVSCYFLALKLFPVFFSYGWQGCK